MVEATVRSQTLLEVTFRRRWSPFSFALICLARCMEMIYDIDVRSTAADPFETEDWRSCGAKQSPEHIDILAAWVRILGSMGQDSWCLGAATGCQVWWYFESVDFGYPNVDILVSLACTKCS